MAMCLVIDGSKSMCAIEAMMVESLGLTAVQATSAADAIRALTADRPDVVILDWDLPKLGAVEFLKVYAAAEAAEGTSARPPVILATTENDPHEIALARTAGVTEVVLKPFDVDQLADALRTVGVAQDDRPARAGTERKRG